jgi:hypothetical protein
MHPNAKLPSQVSVPQQLPLSQWAFAVHTAMAVVVVVLFTLTLAALEEFLLGDESLSALEAALNGG